MTETVIYIKDGVVTNIKAIRNLIKSLGDGKFLITAKSIKKRSLPQNAYYWSVCVPMVKDGLREAGYSEVKTNEDAHEVLKHLFLKKKFTNGVENITVAGSTANLKTVEFNKFLEEIWQWSSTYLGVVIPAPNEQTALAI